VIWREFKALGTDIIISANLPEKDKLILRQAEAIIIDFEKKFSRFLPNNELFRLNNESSGKQKISSTMTALLSAAKDQYLKTSGIFDPTVIGSLENIGYNKTFELVEKNSNTQEIDLEKIKYNFNNRKKMDELRLKDEIAFFPKGFKLDLGGIGKGYIVDFLSEQLSMLTNDYWISAGGDILIKGNNNQSNGWQVAIQDPIKQAESQYHLNTKGHKLGIATSGIIKRQGKTGKFAWHHLIDPRTGLPAINDVLTATVIAPSALEADVWAKTVLILGQEEGMDFIDRQDAACIIFLSYGEAIISKNMEKFLEKYE